ncbi:MAG: acylphosphatase [Gammaproteobacteria bacterium]|nr:acylphosphatase [Gammaproteobacteria bacterium]MBT4462461.1 acylphosphatase [Gammaproteobacteria bacterium]MBT4654687.1 acylphosphatase [Gammaproteobacteria bacterium]MBT5116883.1 acylphosphatase [Gammaproteobacteria bacterium]MBT5761116.1 acylphosphatase [Gammaproteobacteria bacterium]
MNNRIKKFIKIFGKVQGVGYRFWLQAFATRYGVFGWVRNNINGEVEALLIGDEEIIINLIEQCYMGPPSSAVEKILVSDIDDDYDAKSFEILTDN